MKFERKYFLLDCLLTTIGTYDIFYLLIFYNKINWFYSLKIIKFYNIVTQSNINSKNLKKSLKDMFIKSKDKILNWDKLSYL